MSVNYQFGVDAAQLAIDDLAHTSSLRQARLDPESPEFAPTVAFSLVQAVAQAGQLGLGIANAASARKGEEAQTLEIEIQNESQLQVVVHRTETEKIHVVQFPRPIGSGETDTLVLADNDGFKDDESEVALHLLIGSSRDSFVKAVLTYRLDDDGMWQVEALIDEESSDGKWEKAGDGTIKAYAAAVTSSAGDFSIYTAPNDKTEGFLTLNVLDHQGSS